MSQKTFKVLEWLRKVRDDDAERFRDASSEEIIRVTQERADSFRKKLEIDKNEASQNHVKDH